MNEKSDDEALVGFLRSRGHSDEEIEMIVKKLAEHDSAEMRASVFDSLDGGSFDLDKLINEALGRDE